MMDNSSFLGELNQISRLIYRGMIRKGADHFEDGLTGKRAGFLRYIIEQSADHDVLQKDIERHFMIRRSTATGLLKELEKYGFVTRTQSEEDLRQRIILPTEKAFLHYDKMNRYFDELNERLTRDFTEEDYEHFHAIMQKVKANINGIV